MCHWGCERKKFSWKRQAYLFCFELIPAKWKRTMRSFKMPPFCVIFTSETLTFQFLCACKICRALEPCAFTLKLYSLCRVFCLNSPGSCAFEWVERLERNRKLTRARHVRGERVITLLMIGWSGGNSSQVKQGSWSVDHVQWSRTFIDLISGKYIHRVRTCETMFESSENLSTDSDLRLWTSGK